MDQEEEQQRLKKERAADAAAAAAFAKVEPILKVVDSGTKSIETTKTKSNSPTSASSSAGGEMA
jgi:hypothetical protein